MRYEGDHDLYHLHGARTLLSYTATVPAHVVSLDLDDNVLEVECESDRLVVRVKNPERAVFTWPTGTILVGSERWGCLSPSALSPFPVAFYRSVLGLPRLLEGGQAQAGGAMFAIATASVGLADCLNSGSIRFKQTPPSVDDPELHKPGGRQLISGSISGM